METDDKKKYKKNKKSILKSNSYNMEFDVAFLFDCLGLIAVGIAFYFGIFEQSYKSAKLCLIKSFFIFLSTIGFSLSHLIKKHRMKESFYYLEIFLLTVVVLSICFLFLIATFLMNINDLP